MLLLVRGLSKTSKDKLFKILESIAKNQAELKRVTWGDNNTLVLDLRPAVENVSIETGGSKDEG